MPTVALPTAFSASIDSLQTLQTSLRRFLDRSAISDEDLGDCIRLAEARFNRILRVPEMETIATATATGEGTALPSDFLEMRAVYTDGASRYELENKSPVQMASEYGSMTGAPSAYAIVAKQIRLAPIPIGETKLTIVYYAKITGLSETNAVNWLILDHPDIYLYSALAAAEAYLVNDERIMLWRSAADEGINELNAQAARARHGSNLVMSSNVRAVRGVRA